jgi:hypothetical protein
MGGANRLEAVAWTGVRIQNSEVRSQNIEPKQGKDFYSSIENLVLWASCKSRYAGVRALRLCRSLKIKIRSTNV